MEISELREAVELAKELKEILTETPEVANFLNGKMEAFVPETSYRLMTVSEAAKALCVNKNRIGEYVRQGLLECIYTPPASHMKITVRSVNSFIARCRKGEFESVSRSAGEELA
ncbi:hypothetical protein SAMN02745671_01000 [Anaerovibrio lipolyticus DSM 3074]|uniref:Uncharacterized protein n=1 Tax=Anaerovibrio lipolyticus DSM 3074 TaxID=1120997 RepID=A0A1M6C5I8_9FIRM|nr:hypothetical protein [Anaerovibrio lipolyticus]SHI55998.1 hypothetical protein SAMN02745671_01000 [Anaerovibrio lipolyticus DSM 3074]